MFSNNSLKLNKLNNLLKEYYINESTFKASFIKSSFLTANSYFDLNTIVDNFDWSSKIISGFIKLDWKNYYSSSDLSNYKGINVFSLSSFLYTLRYFLPVLYKMKYYRCSFLFCGFSNLNELSIKKFVKSYNIFYLLDGWLYGLLTNWSFCYNQVVYLESKFSDSKNLFSSKINKLSGIFGMRSLPDLIFSASYSRTGEVEGVAKEASTFTIPFVGVSTLENDTRFVTYSLVGDINDVNILNYYLKLIGFVFKKAMTDRLSKQFVLIS